MCDNCLDAIIAKHKGSRGALIPVLHEAQEVYGYLPLEVQREIAEQLDIPLAEVYGVVSFYTQFSINPKGKYKINICMGTACYVKGVMTSSTSLRKSLESKSVNVQKTASSLWMPADASVRAVWLLL